MSIIDTDNLIQSHHTQNALITFIIPTLNRSTLIQTIQSLFEQTVSIWKAILIFDGCSPCDPYLLALLNDQRILCITTSRLGQENPIHNTAGYVRNIGLQLVDTPWIGFVDDDDILTSDYIDKLQQEIHITPRADAIVFKMIERGRIIPPLNFTELVCGQVGISFAYRSSLVKEGFIFEQSTVEDFNLLKQLEAAKKCIVLSPFVTYLVRHSPYVSGESWRIVLQ